MWGLWVVGKLDRELFSVPNDGDDLGRDSLVEPSAACALDA
jgi:hypothetical protein